MTIARISHKMFLHFDRAHFHESWSLKQNCNLTNQNLIGFERLYFYEVTLQCSCKECNQPVVQKNLIGFERLYFYEVTLQCSCKECNQPVVQKNLIGFERLYFYEVTLQYSCKECNQPVVQKSEINRKKDFMTCSKLIIDKLGCSHA